MNHCNNFESLAINFVTLKSKHTQQVLVTNRHKKICPVVVHLYPFFYFSYFWEMYGWGTWRTVTLHQSTKTYSAIWLFWMQNNNQGVFVFIICVM